MLGHLADHLLDRYGGDLRKLREAAADAAGDAAKLAELAGPKEYPPLVAALVRVDLGDGYDAVRRAA